MTFIFNLINDPNDFLSMSISELTEVITNSKTSPFKKVAINKSIPSISAKTLIEIILQSMILIPTKIEQIKLSKIKTLYLKLTLFLMI